MMNDVDGLLDTNILVYAYDKTDERKHKIAVDLVVDTFNGKRPLAISLQNLNEFYVIVTKKSKNILDPTTARNVVAEFLNFKQWKKLYPDEDTLFHAMEMHAKYKLPDFWDTHIAAVMLQNGITTIYTENIKDFKKIPGIKAINPFKGKK